MTDRIAVGTPVTVAKKYGHHDGQNLVVMSDEGGGYGVGIVGNDPERAHSSRHGWLYYDDHDVTPKTQESKVTQFKEGDKVEFIENYPRGDSRVFTGAKATITRGNDSDNLVWLTMDSDGTTQGVFTRRLKLIEEPAFKAGDRVTVKGYPSNSWDGRTGVIDYVSYGEAIIDFEDDKQFKSGGFAFKYLVPAEKPKPFTFADIQVGDTIRRTQTLKGGAKEVREGVVGWKKSWYVATADDTYILAYDTDDTLKVKDVTLELLNRPEPELVKEAWETAQKGDRLVVKGQTGATRILTKQKSGSWETLVIPADGVSHIGFTRSDAEVKAQLATKSFNGVGEPKFIKA